MLLEFKARNYRSIRDEATISAVGSNPKKRTENATDEPGLYSSKWNIRILPALVIFGQNGAGKSNVLQGLSNFIQLISGGDLEKNSISINRFDFQPFLFDEQSTNNSTFFQGKFLFNEVIYEYNLEFIGKHIIDETLRIKKFVNDKNDLVYERKYNKEKDTYIWKFGDVRSEFKIDTVHQLLTKGLKSSKLFIHLLWSSFELDFLKPFKLYVDITPVIFSPVTQIAYKNHTLNNIKADNDLAMYVTKFLNLFDIPISKLETDNMNNLIAFHNEKFQISFTEESDGTKQLFYLAKAIIDSISVGRMFPIDELDAHLHPFITHRIIRLYQNPRLNKYNAQIFFTSHDVTLLDQQLLGRDQIYFANRTADGTTEIESLYDYNVRNDLVLSKAYLEGRFHGLPILPQQDDFVEEASKLIFSNLKYAKKQ